MRIKSLLIGIMTLGMLAACSDSDDIGEAIPIETATNYFPLSMNNQWNYQGHIVIEDHYEHQNNETLIVSDSINSADTPSYFFTSKVNFKNWSLGRVLLRNGQLNKVQGKIVYNGDFIFNFPVLGETIKIPLYNLLLLDQNAAENETLSTTADSLKTTLSLNGKKTPTKVHYVLKTNEGKAYEYYATENERYKDVVSTNLSLELFITTDFPDRPNRILLDNLKVFDLKVYFAKKIGIVSSKSQFNIKFKTLPDSSSVQTNAVQNDSIPADSIIGTSQQTLIDYSVK